MKLSISKFLFVAFSLVSCNWLYSQDSVRNYYQIINRAEISICNSNFQNALEHYDSAFVLRLPWKDDLSNAIECSLDAKDNNRLLIYLKLAKAIGFNPKPAWGIYKRIYAFNKRAIDSLDSYKAGYLCVNRDSLFFEQVRLNAALDQRLDKERIKRYNSKDSLAQMYADSFKLVVNRNAFFLMDWIEKNGFPKEECYYSSDFHLNLFPKIHIMITHYFQGNNWDMYSLLKRAVFNGDLEPIYLAEKERFIPKQALEYGIVAYIFTGSSLLAKEYNLEEINKNRFDMMLEPYSDYLTKIDYILKNGDDRYSFRTFASVFITADYMTFMKFLEQRRNGAYN